MTEYTSANLTEQENTDRNELFRYTDLSHPVMQVLFELKLNDQDVTAMEEQ